MYQKRQKEEKHWVQTLKIAFHPRLLHWQPKVKLQFLWVMYKSKFLKFDLGILIGKFLGWSDGSAVDSTGCSFTGTGFVPPHPQDGSQLSLSSSSRGPTVLFCTLQAALWTLCTYVHPGPHKIKQLKKIFTKNKISPNHQVSQTVYPT